MRIEIETSDVDLVTKLFGSPGSEPGMEVSIPGNATLAFGGRASRRGMLPVQTELLELAISFATGASSSLVANWLYPKLTGGQRTILRIERREVAVNEEGICKAIEESLTMESD